MFSVIFVLGLLYHTYTDLKVLSIVLRKFLQTS